MAVALGLRACEERYSVLFARAIDVVNTLAAAQAADRLKQGLNRYIKPRVLVLDELGLANNTVDAYGRGLEDFLRRCAGSRVNAGGAGRDDVARYVATDLYTFLEVLSLTLLEKPLLVGILSSDDPAGLHGETPS